MNQPHKKDIFRYGKGFFILKHKNDGNYFILLRVFLIRSSISFSKSEENLIPGLPQWGHFFDLPNVNSSKVIRMFLPQCRHGMGKDLIFDFPTALSLAWAKQLYPRQCLLSKSQLPRL